MKVDVVLLDRFSTVVDFVVFLPLLGSQLPGCESSNRLLISDDAEDAVPFSVIIPDVGFLDKLLLGPVSAATMDGHQ